MVHQVCCKIPDNPFEKKNCSNSCLILWLKFRQGTLKKKHGSNSCLILWLKYRQGTSFFVAIVYLFSYPTFIDAVRDLEDCLCMVFLFSTLPSSRVASVSFIQHCRRLSVEFLHYVIASKSLKKVKLHICLNLSYLSHLSRLCINCNQEALGLSVAGSFGVSWKCSWVG